MGSGCSASRNVIRPLPRGAPIREVTFVLLGLDNAGKTTLLANLNNEPTGKVAPTVGFSRSPSLSIGRFNMTLYDLGGRENIRSLWKNYYAESYGLIFVVDASSVPRLEEARETLKGVLQDNRMAGKPLLVFANKQDQDGAIDENEVHNWLQLSELLQGSSGGGGGGEGGGRGEGGGGGRGEGEGGGGGGGGGEGGGGKGERDSEDDSRHTKEDDSRRQQKVNVVKCIALRSRSDDVADPSIHRGVQWLLDSVGTDYDSLSERVRADVESQRAVEAREKKERAERVRKTREERERLEALQRTENEEEREEEGVDALADPFRPIAQVAKEAEERERVEKAAKKAKQQQPPPQSKQSTNTEQLPSGPLQSDSASTTVNIITENTQNSAIEGTRGEERDTQGPAVRTAGGASVQVLLEEEEEGWQCLSQGGQSGSIGDSQSPPSVASGLSDSSASLTDVTQPSREETPTSSDSLHLSTNAALPSSPHPPPSSSHPPRVKLQPLPVPKEKKKQRKMLLSRLKARNKTAPAPEPLTEPPSSSKDQPHTSVNSWIIPRHGNSDTRGAGQNSQGSLPLPDLPQTLDSVSPIAVTRHMPGLGEKGFHVEEDITVPLSSIRVSRPLPSLPSAVDSVQA